MRILYFDLDSCRADHLGCYVYPRPTTPVIDEVAKRSIIFRNCHTSDAPCLPSRAALFSGRLGINNGVTCHDGPASQLRYAGRAHTHDRSAPMWMRSLQQAGWETVSFSSFAQRHLAWWFTAGFTQFLGNQLPGGWESASEVNTLVLPWLQAHGTDDNWFLHINYWDIHTPYHAPEAYYARMRGKPVLEYPNAVSIQHDVETYYGPRTARDWWSDARWQNPRASLAQAPQETAAGLPSGQTLKGLSDLTAQMPLSGPDTWEHYLGFLDGYDAGIAYADEKVGEILETLNQLGVLEETAIIISADHGEAIGELGMYFEHGNGCEGATHIPLIIHWPGVTDQGGVVDGLLYQLDLPPTVLDLLGMDIPSAWDGTSFASAVRGDSGTLNGRGHLISGCGIYSFQRAVRTSRYRLIRTLHCGLYPYDPLYLFDMENDPHQTKNIATEQPAIVAELDHLLLDWTYRHTTGPAGVRDPFQNQLQAGIDPDLYCSRQLIEQRLSDLGSEDQLDDLRRRRDIPTVLQPW